METKERTDCGFHCICGEICNGKCEHYVFWEVEDGETSDRSTKSSDSEVSD